VICLGDFNRIAFVLFASGCEHFLYFLFFHYIAETYFTRYGHLVGLGGCDGYRIGMNTKVSFLHAEGEVEFFQLFEKHADIVTRVTAWGVTDSDSWKNDFPIRGRRDYPLLFDRNYQPKEFIQKMIDEQSDTTAIAQK
jgi:hypothetical protein